MQINKFNIQRKKHEVIKSLSDYVLLFEQEKNAPSEFCQNN